MLFLLLLILFLILVFIFLFLLFETPHWLPHPSHVTRLSSRSHELFSRARLLKMEKLTEHSRGAAA